MATIRPFIPAKDFTASLAFYEAIGFATLYRDDMVAVLDHEGAGLLLQNYHVREWAENCMGQLLVVDLDDWWTRTVGISDRFGVRPPAAPAMQEWGIRVGFLWDPAGVLWHVAEQPPH